MTIEEPIKPSFPTRISRSLSFRLWRVALALFLLTIVVTVWRTFQTHSLQTFVSAPDPKTGTRFSFQFSKRWTSSDTTKPSGGANNQRDSEFVLNPPGRFEAWLKRMLHPHALPTAGQNVLIITADQKGLASAIIEQNGTPFLRTDPSATIRYQKSLIVSGCKASYCSVVEKIGSPQAQVLIVKTPETPVYIGIAGVYDEEHKQAMDAEFDTIIHTFKLEPVRK